jgi:hypothetical protein
MLANQMGVASKDDLKSTSRPLKRLAPIEWSPISSAGESEPGGRAFGILKNNGLMGIVTQTSPPPFNEQFLGCSSTVDPPAIQGVENCSAPSNHICQTTIQIYLALC